MTEATTDMTTDTATSATSMTNMTNATGGTNETNETDATDATDATEAPWVPAPLEPGAPPERPDVPSVWLVDAARAGAEATRLAPGVLDAEERRRAAAFLRDADRRCYVAAHVALRLLLGAALGREPGAVRLVREACPSCGGPHGRPATGEPGLHFSLSHSGDLALVALAAAPVGVDVERVPESRTVAETTRSLHVREVAELRALPADERPSAFARAWSRKEAYLKGLGFGLSRDPSLDYMGTGPAPVAGQDGPAGWTVRDVRVPEGFAAALAVGTPPPVSGADGRW
ncbi:4'-phosphopantetheinyl transferase family protein [Streptomyces sp. NPDC047928]|uniref:4'-phosphopantetheinyl transferase family protein n=1 Tax=unclassified Streptomyces TaxID=2593676 RepID=UPI003723E207